MSEAAYLQTLAVPKTRQSTAIGRFAIRLLVFVVPLAIYLVGMSGAALYAGEFTPLQQIVSLQAGSTPVLYGRAYRDNYFTYKLLATDYRKPEVLVVGSSRSQQIRAMFFDKQPSVFYNAGQSVQSVYDLHQFLTSLKDNALPKVLIVALDQPWFNAASAYSIPPKAGQVIDDESTVDLSRLLSVDQKIFQDLMSGKIQPSKVQPLSDPVYGVQAVGFNAIMNGMGFRNDGTYQYGVDILGNHSNEERLAEGFQFLKDNTDSHFVAGDTVSQRALDELEAVLKFCQAHNITFIGFAPPYAPSIYAQMMADGKHTYIAKEVASIQALFARYNYSYFDFSDARQLGATDDDMIDGFHASEFIYLRLYVRILNNLPDVLNRYSDAAFLTPYTQKPPTSRFELFGNRFN